MKLWVKRSIRQVQFLAWNARFHGVVDIKMGRHRARFRVESAAELRRAREMRGERDLIFEFISTLTPSDIVWDIGANIGSYTVFAAFSAERVIAFEPEQRAAGRLNENLRLNGITNTEVISIALSDHNGTARFSVNAAPGSGRHAISETGDTEITVRAGDDVDVPAPTVIKIDVEGHEEQVLLGMTQLLRRPGLRILLCEVHGGVDRAAISEMLDEAGLDQLRWRERGSEHHVIATRSA